MTLDWHRAESADDLHPDEEVDLGRAGSPGGAEWAYIVREETTWRWGVLDRWLWDDEPKVLAAGTMATSEAAKAAVERWVEDAKEGRIARSDTPLSESD